MCVCVCVCALNEAALIRGLMWQTFLLAQMFILPIFFSFLCYLVIVRNCTLAEQFYDGDGRHAHQDMCSPSQRQHHQHPCRRWSSRGRGNQQECASVVLSVRSAIVRCWPQLQLCGLFRHHPQSEAHPLTRARPGWQTLVTSSALPEVSSTVGGISFYSC